MLVLTLYVTIVFLIALKIVFKLTNGICRSNTCLIGKTALITGGNSGIGYETALSLAARGCRVIIASRTSSQQLVERIKAETKNANIVVKHLNLASFKSVKAFAADLLTTEDRLDILINNAGIAGAGNQFTEDGLQSVLQTNHFGPFLLTTLLLQLLKKSAPSRIIFVSSMLAFTNNLSTDISAKIIRPYMDAAEAACPWTDFRIYANSKLCNVISTRYFAEQLKGTGVTVNALHPGVVSTAIYSLAMEKHTTQFLISLFYAFFGFVLKDCVEGAQTTLHVALSRQLESVTGRFFWDCVPIILPRAARNPEISRRLIEETLRIIKLSTD